jgi:copper homeostasis protein
VISFEVCTASPDGVLAALGAGADRVELCASLDAGGITPSAGLIQWAVATAAGRLAVHVLVRPRPGGFAYTDAETGIMLADIAAAKAAGADGIVLGALTAAGGIDVDRCARLVAAARPASVTFHRAFDETADPVSAFGDVASLGVDRLLTSGAAPTALDGADLIAALVRRSGGRRPGGPLTILAGAGVTEDNAAEIVRRTGVRDLHFSARASGQSGASLRTRIARIMSAARAGLPG